MGLVEQYRACGEGVDRRRSVVLVAVAAEVVSPQDVHEDDAESGFTGAADAAPPRTIRMRIGATSVAQPKQSV